MSDDRGGVTTYSVTSFEQPSIEYSNNMFGIVIVSQHKIVFDTRLFSIGCKMCIQNI